MGEPELPTGAITLLFTDIEGSTRLVEKLGERWVGTLARHDEVLRANIEQNRGFVIKTEGDSFFAVFDDSGDAVGAATAVQLELARTSWPEGVELRVRMGLHTGAATLSGSDYVGLEVHRAARIADAAHGGQILLSEPVVVMTEGQLPKGTSLLDLGKHRLKDLTEPETIFQLSVAGLETVFPEIRTLEAIPNNLPTQMTTFVGREREIKQAQQLLEKARILTLTGPGGTGKTRLSLQIAAQLSGQFEDGVFFVDLSPVSDVEVVPSVVLEALGFSASGHDQLPTERLLTRIASKRLLILMDNFEHILEAAPLVADMARASPRSRLLVTSRAPLRIGGEQDLPVPPLELAPLEGSNPLEAEGVLLFIDRAMTVRPDFRVTDTNASSVVELVRKLDGLPLAIELAASRLRVLSVQAIIDRLDTRMLSSGAADLPERQRTIENTIGWSYDLLDESQKSLFARLGVFAGGARLEEIEALCARWELNLDLIDGLSSLVDNSLLHRSDDAGRPRFRLLHVIREFAWSRLTEMEEADEVQRAHMEVYRDFLHEAAPKLLRHQRGLWLDLLADDHDNIRGALEFGVQSDEVDVVLDIAATAWRFWQARGHLHEARRRLEGALDSGGATPSFCAKALEALGGVLWWQGEMADCVRVYSEALELQRNLGNDADLANALYNQALAQGFLSKDGKQALEILEDARAIYERIGDRNGLGDVEWGIGNVQLAVLGDHISAQESLSEAAEHYRHVGNEFGRGWALFELAENAYRSGDKAERLVAWPNLDAGLRLFASQGDVSAVVLFVAMAAGMALDEGDRHRALTLAGAFNALRLVSGTDLVQHEVNVVDGLDPNTLASLEGEDEEIFRKGSLMSLEETVELTLDWRPTDIR